MNYPYSTDKIAKILRVKPEVLQNLSFGMDKICHKSGVLDQIIAENDFRVKEILELLNLNNKSTSEEVYRAIISKLKKDDQKLFEILEKPNLKYKESCSQLINKAIEISGVNKGFFLKKEKAAEILESYPPENLLKALDYKNVVELLDKEDFDEIYASLRFVESREWMNEFLNKGYKNITPADFEKRKIRVLLLSNKWLDVARKFIEKKYHNVSHLKELGVIFIIPIQLDTLGDTLRVFSLLLHYLHEVSFYSRVIEKFAKQDNFVKKFISALVGEVPEEKKLPDGSWRIVQRYLAKDDINDFRLFKPHVNPETIHWHKAENDISKLDVTYPDLDFTFWKGLNFVGDFFRSISKNTNGFFDNRIVKKNGEIKTLVSMNLIDSIMSLVKEKEMVKYLYHHQEAMWNKIFKEYIGREAMERLIIENFYRGHITREEIKNL